MTKSAVRQGSYEGVDEARTSALLSQIVAGKLSVKDACDLYGLNADAIHEGLRQFRRSALLAFDEQLKHSLINQGANSDALVSAEFTGTLADISIGDLIQTIQNAGKDALMTITVEGLESRIWCSAGAIVDAESGRLKAEAALYRILGFEHGRMVVELRSAPRVRAISASTHGLLLEAAQRKDESVLLWQKLGDVRRRYRLAERAIATRNPVSRAELSVLRLFDRPCSLEDAIHQSDLGDFETLTTLTHLIRGAYLVEASVSLQPLPSLIQTQLGVPHPVLDSLVPPALERAPVRTPASRWRWVAMGVGAILPAALWFHLQAPPHDQTEEGVSTSMGAPADTRAPTRSLASRIEPPPAESPAPPPHVALVLSDLKPTADSRQSPRHKAPSAPKPRASEAVRRDTAAGAAFESSLFVASLASPNDFRP